MLKINGNLFKRLHEQYKRGLQPPRSPMQGAGKMVEFPAVEPLIILVTIWNVHSSYSQSCSLDWNSEGIEGFSNSLIASEFSNFSSISTPAPPYLLQSNMKISATPLQIKSMSTKTKTLSVPSKRKRRLAPLIPPLLPPLIPPLPFLPLPLLPLIPPPILTLVPKVVNPIKSLQKLKRKTDFEKTLKSIGKNKPLKLPGLDAKKNILEKLLDLKKKGSLTTAEFIRFKKLLLR